MGSVTPVSAWEVTVLLVGMLVVVYGAYRACREGNHPGKLILWGALADFGLAVTGYGLGGEAGNSGATLVLLYHGVARLAAWTALAGLVAHPLTATREELQGAYQRSPLHAVLFGFTLVAALGISPVNTPEGRLLVLHALGVRGGLLPVVVVALAYTGLIWVTAATVLAACFSPSVVPRETDETVWTHASFSDFNQTVPTVRALFFLTALLIVLGLGGGFLQAGSALLSGTSPSEMPELAGPWHWGALLLTIAAFPILSSRLVPVIYRNLYAVLVMLVGFLLVCFTALPPLAKLFALIISGIGALVACYSTGYIAETPRKPWYWFLFLMTFGSLLGIVTTENVGSFSVFWEKMGWASFALIAWECTDKARAAAVKYIVICGGASLFMVPGLFMLGGSLTFYNEVHVAAISNGSLVLQCGLFLALIGFAAKAGLVPLHSWLPDAHPAAPSSISAPLSGVLTKMGVFGVVLTFWLLVGQARMEELGTEGGLTFPGMLITCLGLATMAFGELMALRQDDIKRMLAYSTMGQLGEIFTVLGLGTWLAMTGALAHVLNHAIMKDLLFLCAGGLILQTGSRKLSELAGLSRQMPWTVGCMSIGVLAVMGLPPFNGFISKYLMILACINAGQPILAVALLAASLIGAIYYMRILRTLLLDPEPRWRPQIMEVPLSMRTPMIVLAGLCLLFGIAPQTGLSLVAPIAGTFPGMGPALPELLASVHAGWPVFVLLPMLGAIVPVCFRRDPARAGWGAAAILALTTVDVLLFGHELDTLSFIMALVIPAIGAMNLIYSVVYMEHSHTQWRFYTFFLLMTGGLIGVAGSTDLFSFFLFWEIMSSWALYFTIAHEGTSEALREAFKYFLFNIAGAGCLFLGIGILVAKGGTSSFAGIPIILRTLSPAWGTAALILLALGFCMKAAQVSLRIDWQMHPALAPTPVSGYISSVLLKIAVFGLVKVFFAFGGESLAGTVPDIFHQKTIMYTVAWIGAFTLLYSAFQAMRQDRLKLVFIWSTVSQIGYMVLGVSIGSELGMIGGLLHMANHFFFKDLLFLMVGAVMFRTHADSVTELGGVGRRMPVTMFCFFIGALAAVGVPPSSGFTSKWILYQALMEQGEPLLAFISLVGSVVTLAYLARFMHVVFLGQPMRHLSHIREVPPLMFAPMLILASLVIITGIFPGLWLIPLNHALMQYGMTPLDVALGGLTTGAGAWNAPLVTVIMLVAFGGLWSLLLFALHHARVRMTDTHACGLSAKHVTSRIPPASLYPSLTRLWQRKERH